MKELLDKLEREKSLSKEEWIYIFDNYTEDDRKYAAEKARKISLAKFSNKVYIRGIVEFSNVCVNDCYYCGIRRSNKNVERYTLSKEEILECCKYGYEYGYRTFVLQSGEKAKSVKEVAEIVKAIKKQHPDCAVTLSLGELEEEDYRLLKEAGADRYLLRHETANEEHYKKLHPENMSLEHRKNCLRTLKKLGYQTGAGIMVGSPFQTSTHLAEDMLFLKELRPEMIGIGPFLPHKDTPFKDEPKGSYTLTLFLLSLCRLMLPSVLLPATTALGTITPRGREEGILSGANVIMPNLSPTDVRKQYMLYDNKICVNDASAHCNDCLKLRLSSIGYETEISRGDYHD
ncbi:MAG: [Firmicutes bacterium]|nr:[FeFe] hydrogenase H-cluster radical SAM maturase HydE [Bacillota bacterium]